MQWPGPVGVCAEHISFRREVHGCACGIGLRSGMSSLQNCHCLLSEDQTPSLMALGTLRSDPIGRLPNGSAHVDCCGLPVNIAPAEAAELASPHARECRQRDDRRQLRIPCPAAAGLQNQGPNLFRRRDIRLDPSCRGWCCIFGDVSVDPAPFPPLLERSTNNPVVVENRARAQAARQLIGIEPIEVVGGQLVQRYGTKGRADVLVDFPLVLVERLRTPPHPIGVIEPFGQKCPQGGLAASVLASVDGGYQ